MGYVKAIDVLPYEIIKELQQYVSGEVLYIPKKEEDKCSWGEKTSTKRELDKRNQKIYLEFLSGISISELAERYFLVEKSIERIVRQQRLK